MVYSAAFLSASSAGSLLKVQHLDVATSLAVLPNSPSSGRSLQLCATRCGELPSQGLGEGNRKLPTFLHAMPFSSPRVFLEETSLVARPGVPLDVIQKRMEPRCRVSRIHGRSSSPFRSGSPSRKFSRAFKSCYAHRGVRSNALSLQAQDIASPAPNPRDREGDAQNLSAKERRKLRNERREAAKVSQEQPWRERVEERLLEPKKKIRGWQEDADINRCLSKGVQWWMVQTAKKFENEVAEHISIVFPQRFPGRDFEVLVPTVPAKIKLKDGSVSLARKKLYQGIVLLRCLLDRDIYFMVRNIPRTYDFFGNKAGLSTQPIIMPAPVSSFNMEVMFEKIRKQEEEYEEFKEQCRIELEEEKREKRRRDKEQQQSDTEQEMLKSKSLVLAVGATVRVLSGPFLDFTGIVVQLLPKNKIKAIVTVFGNETPIVLDVEDVFVEAAASNQKAKMMYNP